MKQIVETVAAASPNDSLNPTDVPARKAKTIA